MMTWAETGRTSRPGIGQLFLEKLTVHGGQSLRLHQRREYCAHKCTTHTGNFMNEEATKLFCSREIDRIKSLKHSDAKAVAAANLEPPVDATDVDIEFIVLRFLVNRKEITNAAYEAALKKLEKEPSLSIVEILKEAGAITPESAQMLLECKSVVEVDGVRPSQVLYAAFEFKTKNTPIRTSLNEKGWLKRRK